MNKSLLSRLQSFLSPVKNTVIHPQWLSYRNALLFDWLSLVHPHAKVLDIGCFDRWSTKYLPKTCDYIGLDYITQDQSMYQSRMDVIGDGQNLPFSSDTFDIVLLLDVFEHLPKPESALSEINRCLKEKGKLIIQIPFMYPIHDAPYDFSRLTEHGLKKLFEEHGFKVHRQFSRGKPLETAMLLNNIGLSKTVLGILGKSKFIGGIATLLSIPVLILANLIGWFASVRSNGQSIMPFSYQFELEKVSK